MLVQPPNLAASADVGKNPKLVYRGPETEDTKYYGSTERGTENRKGDGGNFLYPTQIDGKKCNKSRSHRAVLTQQVLQLVAHS